MVLQGLIDEVMTGCDNCPLEEYVNGEDDVPVCVDACSHIWEEEFFDILGQEDQREDQDEEAICHWKIFNFSLNLEGIYKMLCRWGIL